VENLSSEQSESILNKPKMSPAYPKKKVLQQAKSSMFVGCWLILKIE
jgi:hypothetical protein